LRRIEGDGFSVAANGTVIEQAQILTTHNLAPLLGPAGVGASVRLDYPRPLGTVKNLDDRRALAAARP
jgi:hypothetical protein